MKKKEKKEKTIKELQDLFFNYKTIFFIGIKNIKVNNLNEIKRNIKKLNLKLKIAKKNLIRIANPALKDLLNNPLFKTPLAIIVSNKNSDLDVVNIINNYQKEIKLEILGCFVNNIFYNQEEILSLNKFKNINEIHAYFVASLKKPLSKLLFDLNYSLIKLNTVVNNIKNLK
jgi:ribosomal protein L10